MNDQYDEPSVPEGFEDIEQAADAAIDPNPLGVDVDRASIEVSDLGQAHVKARNLVSVVKLPEYLLDAAHPERGEDKSLQLRMLDHDIREAMVLGARRLNDNAMKYSVAGWDWDLEDIEYDIPAPRTLVCTLRLTRD